MSEIKPHSHQARNFDLKKKVDRLETLVARLKLENYQHMKDKVVLQDRLLELETIDFVRNSGDKYKKTVLKW